MSDETLAGTAAPRERDGDRRFRRRTTLLLVICSLVLAAVMGRLAQLQLRQHDHFRALRERQTRGVVVREQPRMKIAFRDGELAAQSVAATSIFVDPARIRDRAASARLLARALGWPTGRVQPLLAAESPSNPGRPCRFRWIKRWATAEETARVRALRLRGVGTRTEYRRRYPSGRLAAQILGGVGVDQQGLDGIELAGDVLLRGTSESERVLRDARRRSIAVSADLSRLRDDGGALVLTVHRGVQWIVEAELDRVMAEHRPQWACAVVIDPANGDVLAMANRPTFDPNAFGAAAPASRRNRCVTDTYEPGSTFKPFFLAACLEEGLGRLDEKIGCENGAWTVSGRTIHDHHPYGALSLHDVVVKSSNVGAVKLGLRLSKARGVAGLRKWLADFGFGTETGIPLPGESGGRLMPLSRWSAYTTTSVPIGHEVAVTPLQLAAAYAVFANGGFRVEPQIVRGALDGRGRLAWAPPAPAPRRVLRPETAEQLRRTLADVVESGTGKRARLDGYAVAGKTGTTQRFNPATGRYNGGHIASFAAFAPAEAPRLCTVVVVDRPDAGEYYGGRVAAPAVGRILDRSLRLLEVPPKAEATAQAMGE